jgi:hypothetical protein
LRIIPEEAGGDFRVLNSRDGGFVLLEFRHVSKTGRLDIGVRQLRVRMSQVGLAIEANDQ